MAQKKARRKEKSRPNIFSRSSPAMRELYLNRHDEEKVLLFTAGILFGIGVSSYLIQGETVFTGLTLIILGLILAYVEARQKN